jgi:hypothetical protein
MSKLIRAPLVHFLLIGAALYVAFALWSKPSADVAPNRIVITAGEIEWLVTVWTKQWQRPPTPEERQGLIDDYIRESVMYREALAMGLDQNDMVIRRRLRQKLEFLTEDLATLVAPSEQELRACFEENADAYREPDRITISQVFFNPDRRGDATLRDAEAAKRQLASLDDPSTGGALELGDRLLQPYYPDRSEAELARLFGREFARSIFALSEGAWHGPVLSGYGVHLVYVHERRNAPPPAFDNVREQVRQDWEDDKRQELKERYYAGLVARYEVIVEDPATTRNAETTAR